MIAGFLFMRPSFIIQANHPTNECPNETHEGWIKKDNLTGLTYTLPSSDIPSGYEVTDNCMKAGNNLLYGVGATVINTSIFNNPGGTVCTAPRVPQRGCNLEDISHASFKLERLPDVCEETVLCPDTCRTETLVLDGQCDEVVCYANAKSCEEPDPTPTPTPTPNPEDGKRTGLGIDKLEVCELEEFEVVMDIKENGQGKKDVEVTFTYNGATKKAMTNEGGRARTSFARNGAGSVHASAEGWDSQSQYVEMPVCEPVALDPDRAIGGGQVLGVSTLADTGAGVGILGGFMTMVGGILTTAGVALAKKK